MSFWTFGFHNVSAIETILDRTDFTLDDLLDEEDILQETKAQNKRLLDYITQEEQLQTIFNYLTVEAAEEAEDKYKFKFPYVSCEVLCSEVSFLLDAIVEKQDYLVQLFSFLEREPPLPTVLTPYVCRVAMSLLERRTGEVIGVLKTREGFIPKLLKHLASPPLIDFILKLISVEPPEDEGIDLIGWLVEAKLMSCLVDKFDPTLDEQVHENAASCLVEIIEVCSNGRVTLLDQLDSQENITKFFTYMLTESSSTALLQGLTVLIRLMARHQDEDTFEVPLEEAPAVIKVTLEHISKFHAMLVEGKDQFTFVSTFGEIKQFGTHRLKILEFFLALVKTEYKCVHDVLLELNFFSTCLDLFFQYKWNNFLHHIVDDILQVVFNGNNNALKMALLKDCKLLERIAEASKGNDDDCEKPKGIRRGYMGNLTRIAATIVDTVQLDTELAEFASNCAPWVAFVEGTLTPLQQMEAKPLGGHKPTSFLHGLAGVSLSHVGMGDRGQDDDDDDDEEDEQYEEDEDDDENELVFNEDSTGFVPTNFNADGDDAERASPEHDDEVEEEEEIDPIVTPDIAEDEATDKVKEAEEEDIPEADAGEDTKEAAEAEEAEKAPESEEAEEAEKAPESEEATTEGEDTAPEASTEESTEESNDDSTDDDKKVETAEE